MRSWCATWAFALLMTMSGCAPVTAENVVNLYYPPEEHLRTVVDRCNSEAGGRYRIAYHKLSRDADGQREQMVLRLAAGDDQMDVLGLDTAWTAEFAGAGWIREWVGPDRDAVEHATLPGPLTSARWQGRLFAAPRYTDVQLLWYRADLVDHPPADWTEMIRMAQDLKAAGKPSTVLMPGAQYEGYVVVFNALVASAGGTLISADGTRAEVNGGTVRALGALRALADAGVTSPSLANSREDDVRLAFQRGTAAFQLNWPFVYASMRQDAPELLRQVRWAPYPSIGPDRAGRSPIGGTNLAVSSRSGHPDLAFAAARCLRDAEAQKFSALHDGVAPTLEPLYADPDIRREYPMADAILAGLQAPAIRPVTPVYQNLSTVLAHLLSPPAGIQPERTASEMATAIQNALDSRGVQP